MDVITELPSTPQRFLIYGKNREENRFLLSADDVLETLRFDLNGSHHHEYIEAYENAGAIVALNHLPVYTPSAGEYSLSLENWEVNFCFFDGHRLSVEASRLLTGSDKVYSSEGHREGVAGICEWLCRDKTDAKFSAQSHSIRVTISISLRPREMNPLYIESRLERELSAHPDREVLGAVRNNGLILHDSEYQDSFNEQAIVKADVALVLDAPALSDSAIVALARQEAALYPEDQHLLLLSRNFLHERGRTHEWPGVYATLFNKWHRANMKASR